MTTMTRNRCPAAIAIAACLALAAAAAPAAAQQMHYSQPAPPPPTMLTETPVQIYRGMVENWTPVWIELADLGDGRFAMTAIDGLADNEGPGRVYILQSNGRRGSGCRLTSVDGLDVSFRRCPDGGSSELRADLMGISADVQMVPISPDAAFGYGGNIAAEAVSAFDANCALPTLSRRDVFGGGEVATAGAELKQALAAVRARMELHSGLDVMRTDRLRAIQTLVYNQYELERLAYLDNQINRIMDFRYRQPFINQRQQLEAEFANQPDRIAARALIAETDRKLASIYDPAQAASGNASLGYLVDMDFYGAVDRAIEQDIAANSPLSVMRAIQIENAMIELDNCSYAVNHPAREVPAWNVLNEQFAAIAPTLRATLNEEIESGMRSRALQSRMQEYRRSIGLVAALDSIGETDLLDFADARVAALAASEEQQRNAEIEGENRARNLAAQEAAAAERRRLAFSNSGANAPTDGAILDAYVRYLSQITLTTDGAAWLRPVPDSPFELRTHGQLGGELWRVRFDLTGKSCVRVRAGTYDCSFIIRNQFSNARDGSFESGMMAFSDGMFSILSGRDNEGLTGRIQSNNINRLLLSEEAPFEVRFNFSGGQFDSPQLMETVWDNTVVYLR